MYDFTVPGYENYIAAGVVHHNTFCGGAEVAYHLTGIYPDWWEGRRWDKPIRMWVGSETAAVTRDGIQRVLLGEPKDRDAWGTGMIPGHLVQHTAMKSNVPDAVEAIVVKHVSGGSSTVGFKSYDQGREKWQGETLDLLWFDEEPPERIYMEGLTRTNATGGCVFMTFTPLKGMSSVVRRFIMEQHDDRSDTRFTIEDALHIDEAERAKIIASYPAHELEARTKGIPALGSGRVYPVAQSEISCEYRDIPEYWPRIGGMDFGFNHPFSAVELAWDRDADCIYVTKAFRQKETVPVIHAAALKPWGENLPWAWPHDGLNHEKGSGQPLAEQYRAEGLNMLPERATFDDGSNSVEAGILEILSRMTTGRFKVFSHLLDWFEEFNHYHRDEGKIAKANDDLMDATRYAIMMLRFAQTQVGKKNGKKPKRRFDWVV